MVYDDQAVLSKKESLWMGIIGAVCELHQLELIHGEKNPSLSLSDRPHSQEARVQRSKLVFQSDIQQAAMLITLVRNKKLNH